MTCGDEQFRHAPGPYLLGALGQADRAAFSDHLVRCPGCRAEVEQLRPVVAMLGAVSEAEVAGMQRAAASSGDRQSARGGDLPFGGPTDPPVPDTLLPGLLARASRMRRRRRVLLSSLGGIAAAAIIALTVVLVSGITRPSPAPEAANGQVMVMKSVGGGPVHATAMVTGMPWGTEITLHCHYQASGGNSSYPAPSGPPVYSLKVMDTDGSVHDMGSWAVAAGGDTVFTGGTSVPMGKIGRIEVQDSDGDTVLTAGG